MVVHGVDDEGRRVISRGDGCKVDEAQGNPPLKVDVKELVGFRVALFRCLLIPFNGLRDIFFYAMAKFIDETELILRVCMTLFGG